MRTWACGRLRVWWLQTNLLQQGHVPCAMCAAEVACARIAALVARRPPNSRLEEAGASVRSGNDGDIRFRNRARCQLPGRSLAKIQE